MTNREKAKTLALKLVDIDQTGAYGDLLNILIAMAHWKDEQFKKHLQNKINNLCELGCNTDSQELIKTYADRMVVLAEVMDEIMEGSYHVYNAYVDFDEQLQRDIMEKRKVTIDKIREILKTAYFLDAEHDSIFVYVDSFIDRPNEIISLMLENDKCYLLYDDGVKVCLDDCSWELVDKIYMSIEY